MSLLDLIVEQLQTDVANLTTRVDDIEDDVTPLIAQTNLNTTNIADNAIILTALNTAAVKKDIVYRIGDSNYIVEFTTYTPP